MVRINLIEPKYLTDQHLCAEHVEILMLLSSARKINFDTIPQNFKLGSGHINFFKNKILYLTNRFAEIQKEMKRRDFNIKANLPNIDQFKINNQYNNWQPNDIDKLIIKNRILEKIQKKPNWYTYKRNKFKLEFYEKILENAR